MSAENQKAPRGKTVKRLRKIKTPTMRWPVESKEEVNDSIKRIGDLQRERVRIQAEMNDEINALNEIYAKKAKHPAEEINGRIASVQAWCESRRAELTKTTSKTVKFDAGEVSWRKCPPKVSIRKVEAVIQELQERGGERFLRKKVEIDKAAILKEPGAILKMGVKGITVSSGGEDFLVQPSEKKLEEAA